MTSHKQAWTKGSDLQSLIERVEKASWPDRELDADVFQLVGGKEWDRAYNDATKPCGCPHDIAVGGARRAAPPYSASLDAVMALKQDGHTFALGDCNEDSVPWACVTSTFGTDYAATGPDVILAALAAILKSRLATNGGGVE
jgi:hypothetical protein